VAVQVKAKKSHRKPLKALHLFITSSLMAVVNSKALLQLCSCKPVSSTARRHAASAAADK